MPYVPGLNSREYRAVPISLSICWAEMAPTAASIVAVDMDGSKINTLGPKSGWAAGIAVRCAVTDVAAPATPADAGQRDRHGEGDENSEKTARNAEFLPTVDRLSRKFSELGESRSTCGGSYPSGTERTRSQSSVERRRPLTFAVDHSTLMRHCLNRESRSMMTEWVWSIGGGGGYQLLSETTSGHSQCKWLTSRPGRRARTT